MWRKVLPACKFFSKLIICAVLISGFSICIFAQSIEMPDMPKMPEMPAISNPTLDGNYYKPSMPNHGSSDKKVGKDNNTAANSTAILSDANSSDDIISSFLSTNSNLTANDISSLYDSGLFTNISSLTGLLGTAASSATYQDDETKVLLKQILDTLQELKTSQNNATAAEKQILTNYQQDSATFKQREPSILRFKVNGYSLTESFTKVFFSEPESDGSFLLTADRRYFANQKQREETVYILFKAVKSRGTSVVYEVQPSIVQTTKNDQSYVYKFAQLKGLAAEKTGNLVVLHSDSGDTTVDMLLDIDY